MNTESSPFAALPLVRETEARLAQALDNFFQRSRPAIIDGVLRTISSELTPSMLATGQTCVDWLNAYPDRLSTAFADQFRLQLARPGHAALDAVNPATELRLVDDDLFGRQLAENKVATQIAEAELPLLPFTSTVAS